jgi:hypothetical protein
VAVREFDIPDWP